MPAACRLSGIKTGFNEAFLIDTPTKEALVAADPKSASLFKPYLRGQDIDRWQAEWTGLWMLAMKSSGNHEWPWSKAGDGAEAVFAATYPAIHAHLNQYREALIKRQDQGEYLVGTAGVCLLGPIRPAEDHVSGDPISSVLSARPKRNARQ